MLVGSVVNVTPDSASSGELVATYGQRLLVSLISRIISWGVVNNDIYIQINI